MNYANKITIIRVLLIPVFIVMLGIKGKYSDGIAALIFVIVALTDLLDGYIARKRKEITTLGKLLDPLADKLLISAALIFLIGRGVPAWMAFVIIAREFIVTGLRLSALSQNVTLAASDWGKIKTAAQMSAIVAVIINFPFNWWLMLIATILTVFTGIDYFVKAGKFLRG